MKKDWQKRLRRRNGVWNEAVKYYLVKIKQAKQREELLTAQLIRQAFNNEQSLIDTGATIGASVRLCRHQKEVAILKETTAQKAIEFLALKE